MFAAFTQRINPLEVLQGITCWHGPKETKKNLVPLKLITEKSYDQISEKYPELSDSAINYSGMNDHRFFADSISEDKYIVFAPQEPLPHDSVIYVKFSNIPSAGTFHQ
jgi:hypothetical protein